MKNYATWPDEEKIMEGWPKERKNNQSISYFSDMTQCETHTTQMY